MSLASRVNDLAIRIATEVKVLKSKSVLVGIPYTAMGLTLTSSGSPGANRCLYMKLTGGTGAVSGFYITAFTVSGNICVAVYSGTGTGTNARPNTRKATTGSIACPSGEAFISLPVTISEGDWLAVTVDNGTATFGRVSGNSDSPRQTGLVHRQENAFPAPTNATPGPAYAMSVIAVGVTN